MGMDLLKDIKSGKMTYDDFYHRFLAIVRKAKKGDEDLTQEEKDFINASMPVLATNPKEFLPKD